MLQNSHSEPYSVYPNNLMMLNFPHFVHGHFQHTCAVIALWNQKHELKLINNRRAWEMVPKRGRRGHESIMPNTKVIHDNLENGNHSHTDRTVETQILTCTSYLPRKEGGSRPRVNSARTIWWRNKCRITQHLKLGNTTCIDSCTQPQATLPRKRLLASIILHLTLPSQGGQACSEIVQEQVDSIILSQIC